MTSMGIGISQLMVGMRFSRNACVLLGYAQGKNESFQKQINRRTDQAGHMRIVMVI